MGKKKENNEKRKERREEEKTCFHSKNLYVNNFKVSISLPDLKGKTKMGFSMSYASRFISSSSKKHCFPFFQLLEMNVFTMTSLTAKPFL